MKALRLTLLAILAAGLGVGAFLLQQKWQQPEQPRVELKVSLEDQQTAVVQATQAAGGDLPAALAKFRTDHAAELAAREAAEANQVNLQSYERDHLRQKTADRVTRIHKIQQELKAGKSPSEIVPPRE